MGSWVTENAWWREMAKKMVDNKTTEKDWRQANRSLWCLSFVAGRPFDVPPEARHDLVQQMLLRLQEANVADLLACADAPAHYIARMMRNHLTQQDNRNRKVGYA